MIRNKIDPRLDNLEALNIKLPWIPGRENIRPSLEIIKKKMNGWKI